MANPGSSDTEYYASLKVKARTKSMVSEADKVTAEPGEEFSLFIDVTLNPGSDNRYKNAVYKLFVLLPSGFTKISVGNSEDEDFSVPASSSWTGAAGTPGLTPEWDMSDESTYRSWLLATWPVTEVILKNAKVNASFPIDMGWTIKVKIDEKYDVKLVADIDATLFVSQDGVKKNRLDASASITFISAGPAPAFSAIRLLDSYQINGHWVVGNDAGLIGVEATLLQPTTQNKIWVRWQVKGGGWNPASEIAVSSATKLEPFTIHHDFTHSVTLLFSCAEVGKDNWGQSFEVAIDVVAEKLQIDKPVIRVDSAARIILTGTVSEPSTLVIFEKLQVSVDGGANWHLLPESSLKKSAGSAPYHYSVSYDMTGTKASDRDFSQGVLLRATDKLQRPTPLQAQFDADSFLTALWDSATTPVNDVDLGEQIIYAIHLHCAQGVVLPAATLSLLLPEAAVEAVFPALSWYWMMDETSGEPKGSAHESNAWRGTAGDSKIYSGSLQSGLIHAVAKVRANPLLLGHALPGATLSVSSAHFLHPFVSQEAVRAMVFRPAPAFQFILFLGQHTNQYAVTLRGNFIPLLEDRAQLVFTAVVDHGVPQTVPPAAIYLSPGYFELLLDHRVFTEFAKDGDHSVTLTIRRTTDNRAALRSSHSETLVLTLKNSAASFEDTSVRVKSGDLILDGKVIAPSAENPVKVMQIFWDGSGQGTAARPLVLTADENGRSSFHDALALNQFDGALHPVVKAFTQDGDVDTPLNLLFPTASGLLEIVLTVNGSSVSDGSTALVSAGAITFKISVTSRVGLPQKLNMFMTLGKAFATKSGALFIVQPAAGKGTVHETEPANSWNGISSAQLLQVRGLAQGATFSIQGATELKKEAGGAEAETLRIAFTEPDEPPYTFRAQDKDDGVIFTARLQAQ